VAWIVLVPAEYLGVTSGLGYAINDARDTLDYARLAATVVVIGIIGFSALQLGQRNIKPERGKTMSEPATVLTGCLAPIDKGGLDGLIEKGKANPEAIKTLKCKTVAEGKFRHANYIRDLEPYIVDEPPGLLGDDTAPNPSEASLAALGSCICVGLHANAVHRGITVQNLEVEMEGDLNITAVWGTGDVSEKPVGFTDVRLKVTMECDAPDAVVDELIAHVCQWSPVFNTFSRPVNMIAERV